MQQAAPDKVLLPAPIFPEAWGNADAPGLLQPGSLQVWCVQVSWGKPLTNERDGAIGSLTVWSHKIRLLYLTGQHIPVWVLPPSNVPLHYLEAHFLVQW